MLKVCWDCFFGNEDQNEVVHGTARNGQALGGVMAQRENEMVFRLPKPLNYGDILEVKGNMKPNPKNLSVALLTGTYKIDYDNVAGEVEANFSADEDYIKFRTVVNGIHDELLFGTDVASQLFKGTEFILKFTMLDNAILIHVDESVLEPYNIKHSIEDITYLILSNDILKINELKFIFNN